MEAGWFSLRFLRSFLLDFKVFRVFFIEKKFSGVIFNVVSIILC